MKTNRTLTHVLAAVALSAVSLAAGCNTNIGGYLLYAFAGDAPKKTVKAECNKLQGKRVAIVIFADQAVQFEYPMARLELSAVLAEELRAKVKDIHVVDPRTVLAHQDADMHWDSAAKTTIGKRFGADYVLYIGLAEFTTREVGTLNLYRGRIAADVALYNTALDERKACEWRSPDIRVQFPTGGPGKLKGHEPDIRYRTEKLFADKLAKKFYTHKAPAVE